VAATLATARLGGWTRVVAVFQPHLYSRTRLFARELGEALAAADVVLVTDVYAAREEPQPGVDGGLVAAAARQARPGLDCAYVPDRRDLAKHVAAAVRPGDLVVTLGAGDITTLPDELADLLPGGREAPDGHGPVPDRGGGA
jgi:UDP-N-acetylmuramate--alanine ligase